MESRILREHFSEMIQVYTGNGKGKTTAAIGQAIRALGQGFRVLMIQFMKGDPNYGEIKFLRKKIPSRSFKIIQSGLKTFVKKGAPKKEDRELAKKGFRLAKRELQNGKYPMVILDEINVAIHYDLLQLSEVLSLIDTCPENVELVLTGRYAPKELIERADLVSVIREVKHPYKKGIVSRKGIDY